MVFSTFEKDQLAKIYQQCLKERLKICKLAEFKSNMLEKSKDIAPQSHIIELGVPVGGSPVKTF